MLEIPYRWFIKQLGTLLWLFKGCQKTKQNFKNWFKIQGFFWKKPLLYRDFVQSVEFSFFYCEYKHYKFGSNNSVDPSFNMLRRFGKYSKKTQNFVGYARRDETLNSTFILTFVNRKFLKCNNVILNVDHVVQS